MIKKVTMYEVNGTVYPTEEEALRADNRYKEKEYIRVATKYREVLELVASYTKIVNRAGMCRAVLEVTDEELLEDWGKDTPYAEVFKEILRDENIRYWSYMGDEQKQSYLKISLATIWGGMQLPTVGSMVERLREKLG